MFFTRKKNQKRLWGLRVNTSDRASSSPDPPHHHHHQHHHHHLQPLQPPSQHHHHHHPHPHHHHHQQHQPHHYNHPAPPYDAIGLPPQTQPAPPMRGRKSIGAAADGGLAHSVATAFMNCCGGAASAAAANSSDSGCAAGSPMDTSPSHIGGSITPPPAAATPSSPSNGATSDLYTLFCALMKRLKEPQILTLCTALEQLAAAAAAASDGGGSNSGSSNSGGSGATTNCVLVPRDAIDGQPDGPHVLACRIWRWSDVRCADELRRVPDCPSAWDPVYECCNPCHWSRQMLEETPPPPYRLFAMDRLKPEDLAPSEERLKDFGRFPGPATTEGEDSLAPVDGWCQLAYWELSQRVGQLYPVANAAINVFAEQPRADGLCLASLAAQRRSATPDAVLKARSKIGMGVTLSREADGVWLFNRSAAPVFVHSPTLNDLESRSVLVYRVPPGHCLRAFDHEKAASELNAWSTYLSNSGGAQTGPIDIYSVRISFAKGWGPNYQRQEVTACPCWLEVHLSRCR